MTQTAPLSVFVTGATGALGREITRQLKAAGFRVTGATNGYENAALVRADGGIPAYPDVMRAGEMRSIMQSSKAEIVVNCAPQHANHLPQVRGTEWNARLMDEGVSALLEAAQAAGVKYVVHTSYAFADADSEELGSLIEAVRAGEDKVLHGATPASVLRLGFVYGAGSPELVGARDTLLQGKSLDRGLDIRAAWINAPDAARAALLAIQQRATGRYTIIEDELASPAEFIGYFAESQGMSRPGHAPRYASWAQPSKAQIALMSLNPHVSSAEAKDKLGWQPRFPSYRQGIDDVLLSWRAVAEA